MKPIFIFILCLSSFFISGQKFHTKFEYTDSVNKGITIENSYPKGGLKYTALNGERYVYLVFWTHITNKTDTDLKLTINFPTDAFVLPSSHGAYFKLYLPFEKMAFEKEHMFNYGLDLKSFLDKNINNPSKLETTITSSKSYSFYVLALSDKGTKGRVRAGFELQEHDLIYRINDYQFSSGKLVIKD